MGNERKRVVVTGMGAISPPGNDVETSRTAANAGKSGAGLTDGFGAPQFRTRIGAEVKHFNADEYIPPKEQRRMDRFIHYAIAACKQAQCQGNLEITPENTNDVGVIMGSGIGGIEA